MGLFHEAFADLAHHLFPDGHSNLPEGWPRRRDRKPVSPDMALLSVSKLENHAQISHLSKTEAECVALAACATLPNYTGLEGSSVGPASPLVEREERLFQRLVKCILIKSNEKVSAEIIWGLLSVNLRETGSIRILLRFLSLAWNHDVLDVGSVRIVESAYSRFFGYVFTDARRDALRLLLLITRKQHVRRDRYDRLLRCFHQEDATSLLQLYRSFRPDLFTESHEANTDQAWSITFPDLEWEENFRCRPIKKSKLDVASKVIREFRSLNFLPLGLGDDSSTHRYIADTNHRDRFRTCSPFILRQHWYESDKSRSEIIRRWSCFSVCTADHLLCDDFLINEVLEQWDGSLDLGTFICLDLVPLLAPREDWARLFNLLRTQVEGGDPRLHYLAILALARIVRCWSKDGSLITKRYVEELMRSSLDLINCSLLQFEHELIRLGIVDFYIATIDVHMAPLPFPRHVYRFLLSSSVSADQICWLLVNLKSKVVKLKEESKLDEIRVYNSYLWDFCSILWRASAPPMPGSGRSILYSELRQNIQRSLYERGETSLSLVSGSLWVSFAKSYGNLSGKPSSKYLDHLHRTGFEGISLFLRTFVQSLATQS